MSFDGSSSVLFGAVPSELKLSASDKRALSGFGRKLSTLIADRKPFLCLITNDEELRRLNNLFLHRDYPADVLSFPALDQSTSLGECAISIQRAAHQAAQFRHSLIEEIQILMLHGFLHLTGLDHENDSGQMAQTEQHWRAEFKLPQTLIQRAHHLQTADL